MTHPPLGTVSAAAQRAVTGMLAITAEAAYRWGSPGVGWP
jgi:hypothetical protein